MNGRLANVAEPLRPAFRAPPVKQKRDAFETETEAHDTASLGLLLCWVPGSRPAQAQQGAAQMRSPRSAGGLVAPPWGGRGGGPQVYAGLLLYKPVANDPGRHARLAASSTSKALLAAKRSATTSFSRCASGSTAPGLSLKL